MPGLPFFYTRLECNKNYEILKEETLPINKRRKSPTEMDTQKNWLLKLDGKDNKVTAINLLEENGAQG